LREASLDMERVIERSVKSGSEPKDSAGSQPVPDNDDSPRIPNPARAVRRRVVNVGQLAQAGVTGPAHGAVLSVMPA